MKPMRKDSIINIKVSLAEKLGLNNGPIHIQVMAYKIGDSARFNRTYLPKIKPDTLFRFKDSLLSIISYGNTIVLNALVPNHGARTSFGDVDGKGFFMIRYPSCEKDLEKDFEGLDCDFPVKKVKLFLLFDCKVQFSNKLKLINSLGVDKQKLKEDMKLLIKGKDSLSIKFIKDLNDSNEYVRSNAAMQLHKMKHPQAISACIRTINDAHDILHMESTPSVYALIESGKPALLPLTELMLWGDENTRMRASKAIEQITYNLMNDPKSKNDKAKLKKWRSWWKEIGLNYTGIKEEREIGIKKLKEWISKNEI
jgi:hypothetical protein